MLKKIWKYMMSVGTYFAASFLPVLLMVVANPFIAMNMSPEDYAITGYYNSFVALFSPVIVFYMINYYNKRYYEVSPEERLRIRAMLFKALIFFSFAVSVLCLLLLCGYICIFRKDMEFPLYPYALLMVFAIPLTGVYKLEQAECRMSRNARGYFRITAASGVILVVTNLLFVVAAKWGAFGKLLAPLVTNAIIFVYLAVKYRRLFRVHTEKGEFIKAMKFCLPLAAGAMLGYFFNGFDRTYLESIGDVTEYGNYIVGAQIAGYLTTLSTAVTSTFQPDIYESISKGNSRSLAATCLMQIGLIAGIVLFFMIFCPLIIRILTAGRYMDAVPYARIISVSTLTSSIYFIVNNYTIARGYPGLYLYTTLLGSVMTVLAYPPVVASYGYSGGAYMVGMSFVFLAATNLILLCIVHLRKKQ
ncbi:MAG: oligosaccharide flippase family protein [Bacteroidales bacterium]|nr:oligosaccharide flippase family protein [Bacteroidales bacterium]